MLILNFNVVLLRLHDVTNFLNHNTRVGVFFFYRDKMTSFLNYVTTTLRAHFARRGSNITSLVSDWLMHFRLFFCNHTERNMSKHNRKQELHVLHTLYIDMAICSQKLAEQLTELNLTNHYRERALVSVLQVCIFLTDPLDFDLPRRFQLFCCNH